MWKAATDNQHIIDHFYKPHHIFLCRGGPYWYGSCVCVPALLSYIDREKKTPFHQLSEMPDLKLAIVTCHLPSPRHSNCHCWGKVVMVFRSSPWQWLWHWQVDDTLKGKGHDVVHESSASDRTLQLHITHRDLHAYNTYTRLVSC